MTRYSFSYTYFRSFRETMSNFEKKEKIIQSDGTVKLHASHPWALLKNPMSNVARLTNRFGSYLPASCTSDSSSFQSKVETDDESIWNLAFRKPLTPCLINNHPN